MGWEEETVDIIWREGEKREDRKQTGRRRKG
jgi:hypothetical protein